MTSDLALEATPKIQRRVAIKPLLGPALMLGGGCWAWMQGPLDWAPEAPGWEVGSELGWMGLIGVGGALRLRWPASGDRWLAKTLAVRESWTERPLRARLLAGALSLLFLTVYFYPEFWRAGLGTCDATSRWLRGKPADVWFFYGLLYTGAVVLGSLRLFKKYRGDAYQTWRTRSVVFFQVVFAFFIPALLEGLLHPEASFSMDIKYFWPLNYTFFDPWHLEAMQAAGVWGRVFWVAGLAMFLGVAPWATMRWGKGWYCSWVCGCAALAETAGDGVRHLSDPSPRAWQWERRVLYAVLAWVVISTAFVLIGYFRGSTVYAGWDSYAWVTRPYALVVGSLFSGVAGVGFYPVFGNRFWCRFGCPLAAYMGIFQRWASRFRVATDGGNCIACGQCTVQCEMGIDVRAYAMAGQDVVRSGCVGCGICVSVCPSSVLRLENDLKIRSTSHRDTPQPWPLEISPHGVRLNQVSKEH